MENWLVETYNFIRFMPRSSPRLPIPPVPSPILIRIFLRTIAIEEYQVFQSGTRRIANKRRNSITIHFVNKTQQRNAYVPVSSKLHLPDLTDHLVPLVVSTCARVPADHALQRDAPERECNYFPLDAREGNSTGDHYPHLTSRNNDFRKCH